MLMRETHAVLNLSIELPHLLYCNCRNSRLLFSMQYDELLMTDLPHLFVQLVFEPVTPAQE